MRELHAERAEALFLEVDETNLPAIALYRRLRFVDVGSRPAYYQHAGGARTGALVMRRESPLAEAAARAVSAMVGTICAWSRRWRCVIAGDAAHGAASVAGATSGPFSIRPVAAAWHRIVLSCWAFACRSTGSLRRERPLLIAANHVSWTDIMVLGSLRRVAFIAKSEVAGWPLFGMLARLQRTVFVDREPARQVGRRRRPRSRRGSARDDPGAVRRRHERDGNSPAVQVDAVRRGRGTRDRRRWPSRPARGDRLYAARRACPWAASIAPHVAWMGDQTLVPHLVALLRDGAIDVEVHFGEPIAFARRQRRASRLPRQASARCVA